MNISFWRRLYYRVKYLIRKPVDFNEFLNWSISRKSDYLFIEIGAYDGKTNDPIYKHVIRYGLHGVLVEPVRDIFIKLKRNYYKQDSVYFENVAIHKKKGNHTFFRIKRRLSNFPHWYDQLGSFCKNVIQLEDFPNKNKMICSEKIRSIAFMDLINKYSAYEVDLVVIDTEGYDFEIIKTIDFRMIHPNLLYFESKHLSLRDYRECKKLLKSRGYQIRKFGPDTLAFDFH